MLISDKNILASNEKTCEECGKTFVVFDAGNWAYKLPKGPKGTVTAWYCRYNCVRAAERKREESKKRGKKEVKPVKPFKYELEDELKENIPIAQIAKRQGVSVQTVHNWTKSYGLDSYVVKKSKAEREPVVQESPTLIQIEQFHTDVPGVVLPEVEMAPIDDKTFYRTLAMVEADLVERKGMTEEENMSDEVWEDEQVAEDRESPLDKVITENETEAIGEEWKNIRASLGHIRRMSILQIDRAIKAGLEIVMEELA